jgi:hypothetical protein
MSDYGTIIARIGNELAVPALVPRVPDAIQAAIRFYESERFWFLEGEATASTVASQQAYAVPTDFLEGDALTLTNSDIRYMLKRRPWSWMRRWNIDTTVTAQPWNWSYYADQFYLWPVPDAVYTLTLSYLKRLATLSAYADTNAWMTHGEELIRERAKYDLVSHGPVRDYQWLAQLQSCVDVAFRNLRAKSEQKVSTGILSVDQSLIQDTPYNVNYQ